VTVCVGKENQETRRKYKPRLTQFKEQNNNSQNSWQKTHICFLLNTFIISHLPRKKKMRIPDDRIQKVPGILLDNATSFFGW
jgi:hypothetical protein